MIDTHDEENQKGDMETVFHHSQYKFKSSFFLQIGEKNKPHSGKFTIKAKHSKLNNMIYCALF